MPDASWLELPWLHTELVVVQLVLALVTALALVFISAPYGRHARAGWGPTVPARVGWVLMEAPASLLFAWWFLRGPNALTAVPLCFFLMWQSHYVYRAFVYPFRLRVDGKRMPALVMLLAIAFNTLNAFINATWVGTLGSYPDAWFTDPRMWIGVTVFFVGMFANHRADARLLALRADGSTGYRIPRGGLHDYVSSPNYLGEVLEWAGWAIATWSFAGLAYLIYALANLVPRAVTHHKWYRATFPDYPPERRAIFPFLL